MRVVVFGSARTKSNEKDYKVAYKLTKKLAQNNIDVITGGGPGIMEASNKGAMDGNGKSYGYGLNIRDQVPNIYCSKGLFLECKNFQERKKLLMQEIDVFIVFPGGFGTLDEFFEVVVHILTNKIKPVPIILYNKNFWKKLVDWFNFELVNQRVIKKEDNEIFKVSDSLEEIFENIWKNNNS